MTQVPGAVKVTVPPEYVDTRPADGSMVNVITWGISACVLTWTVCWAWRAARNLALPSWLASMTQVPGAVKVTMRSEMEHVLALDGSMANVTGLPDRPPVAAT